MLVKEVYTFFSHSLGIVYIGGNILKCKIFDIYHVCSKRTWKGNPVAKKYICGTSVEKQYRIFFCDDLMPWADINKSDFVLQRSIMFKFQSTMILISCHIKIVPLPMDWSCAVCWETATLILVAYLLLNMWQHGQCPLCISDSS